MSRRQKLLKLLAATAITLALIVGLSYLGWAILGDLSPPIAALMLLTIIMFFWSIGATKFEDIRTIIDRAAGTGSRPRTTEVPQEAATRANRPSLFGGRLGRARDLNGGYMPVAA